jgi:hypothetical protein
MVDGLYRYKKYIGIPPRIKRQTGPSEKTVIRRISKAKTADTTKTNETGIFSAHITSLPLHESENLIWSIVTTTLSVPVIS